MPYSDPVKAKQCSLESGRRYRQRQKLLNPKQPPGRHGNHAKGSNNGRWNSGVLRSSHGYILRRVPKDHHRAFGPPGTKHAYAYEHDLIMEAAIGRPLTFGEVVHHKNGVKTDNRAENLEVTTASEHMAHHDAERGRDVLGRFKPASDPAEWPSDLRVREFPEGLR